MIHEFVLKIKKSYIYIEKTKQKKNIHFTQIIYLRSLAKEFHKFIKNRINVDNFEFLFRQLHIVFTGVKFILIDKILFSD